MVKVAAIQMASGPQVAANLIEAERWLVQAAQAGARIAVLPEHFACMGLTEHDKLEIAEVPGAGMIQDQLARIAPRERLWIVAGTIPLRLEGQAKVSPACLVFDDQGQQAARFDKLHLFDVRLPVGGEAYCESSTQVPGDRVVVVDTPAGRMGLAVCYDLRFPHLHRALAMAGAEVILNPAAFTVPTGQAHWEPLLRARAIETGAFVLAAAQTGLHPRSVDGPERRTYGHSLAISPWGEVLVDAGEAPGISLVDLDLAAVKDARRRIPALTHDRPFAGP